MLNFIGLIYGGRIDIKSYFIIQFITRCDIILGNKLISSIYDAFWNWTRQIILILEVVWEGQLRSEYKALRK